MKLDSTVIVWLDCDMPIGANVYTVTRTGLLAHINDLIESYESHQDEWDDEWDNECERFHGELCAMAITVARGIQSHGFDAGDPEAKFEHDA